MQGKSPKVYCSSPNTFKYSSLFILVCTLYVVSCQDFSHVASFQLTSPYTVVICYVVCLLFNARMHILQF